jgi:hypothetical protein
VSYFGGYFGGGGSGGGTDGIPPTVSVVSPTPGVAPGAPGGFPRTISAARNTPIILDVTDVDGVDYFVVTAKFYGLTAEESITEEVVYRRGLFRGPYIKLSNANPIVNGTRLSVRRDGGWPAKLDGTIPHIQFFVDALDSGGSLTDA